MSKTSILSRLRLAMMSFGLLMGVIFPFYANFFVTWKPGLQFWFNSGAVVAGITVGLVNHALLKRMLLRHIHHIAEQLEAISSGDYRTQNAVDSDDILGTISNHINASALRLGKSQQAMDSWAKSIQQEGSQVAELVFQIKNQLADLKNQMVAFDKKFRQQDDNLSQLQATQEKLRQVMQQLTLVSQQVVAGTSDMMESSRSTTKIASQRQSALQSLTEKSQETGQIIQSVNSAALSIGSIANKTRMLALNATIEASSAGEAGKSFAVVATEVKDLSQQSDQQAKTLEDNMQRLAHASSALFQEISQTIEATQEEHGHLHAMQQKGEAQRLVLQKLEQEMGHSTRELEGMGSRLHSFEAHQKDWGQFREFFEQNIVELLALGQKLQKAYDTMNDDISQQSFLT